MAWSAQTYSLGSEVIELDSADTMVDTRDDLEDAFKYNGKKSVRWTRKKKKKKSHRTGQFQSPTGEEQSW